MANSALFDLGPEVTLLLRVAKIRPQREAGESTTSMTDLLQPPQQRHEFCNRRPITVHPFAECIRDAHVLPRLRFLNRFPKKTNPCLDGSDGAAK